jgi:Acyl-CoA dehydrogenase, C-terminal domain
MPDIAVATAVAASFCRDVAVHAAEEAVQLHGGIGMTWEHAVHLYLKRAKSNQIGLGYLITTATSSRKPSTSRSKGNSRHDWQVQSSHRRDSAHPDRPRVPRRL